MLISIDIVNESYSEARLPEGHPGPRACEASVCYVHIHIYIYIYICISRERERERDVYR